MTSRPEGAGRLFVVRHAPVAVTGVCYGHADVPLRLDAREAADVVLRAIEAAGLAPRRVWSSPAARARDVAALVAADRGVPLSVDARIAELAMGVWEGRAFAAIEAEDGARFARWMSAWRTEAPPGGETLASLVARVTSFTRERWGELATRDDGGDALAVCHAGVIRAMRAEVRGVSYEEVLERDGAVPHLTLEPVMPRSGLEVSSGPG